MPTYRYNKKKTLLIISTKTKLLLLKINNHPSYGTIMKETTVVNSDKYDFYLIKTSAW